MSKIIRYAPVVLSCLLSGCILVDQQTAQEGRTALIGKSRAQILACAGVPSATFRDGATEYFAYAASGRSRGGRTAYVGDGMFVHSGGGQAQCVATVTFQSGRVANVNYRSSGGAITAPDEACANVVRTCL